MNESRNQIFLFDNIVEIIVLPNHYIYFRCITNRYLNRFINLLTFEIRMAAFIDNVKHYKNNLVYAYNRERGFFGITKFDHILYDYVKNKTIHNEQSSINIPNNGGYHASSTRSTISNKFVLYH